MGSDLLQPYRFTTHQTTCQTTNKINQADEFKTCKHLVMDKVYHPQTFQYLELE